MDLTKILILSTVLIISDCFCDKIEFNGCNRDGFTCENGERVVTYQCQEKVSHIMLWQFLGPLQVDKLTIKNCNSLQLDLTYDAQGTDIRILHIENIADLQINSSEVCNPQSVIFENVIIGTIPSGTFSKNNNGCFNNTTNLDSIIIKNSNIGTIEYKAFEHLTNMKLFQLENTIVREIDTEAIQIIGDNICNVLILNNNLGKIGNSAFQINRAKLIISGNVFSNIPSHAIKGSLQNFQFTNNVIHLIETDAFSFTVEKANVENNYCERVYPGAFQKIEPGQVFSQNPKFLYNFQGNSLKYAINSSIRPNVSAYRRVNGNVLFINNSIECTCEKMADPICKTSSIEMQNLICENDSEDVNLNKI